MTIQIKKPKIEDIDQIYKIEFDTYSDYGWSKNVLINELLNPSSRYLAAFSQNTNEKILAYIGCWVLLDEGHITTLVVHQKFRKRHIADILLYNLIINLIKEKIKWLTLEVKVSNLPAISLYKKFGFKELGIRKNYYQDSNEDALILWSENIQSPEYKEKLNGIINLSVKKNMDTDKLQYVFE